MQCPRCGYMMSDFDADCPRCQRVDPVQRASKRQRTSEWTPRAIFNAVCLLVIVGMIVYACFTIGGINTRIARSVAESAKEPLPAAPTAGISSTTASTARAGIRPEVRTFFELHPEFGRPTYGESLPDWAEGPRQRVMADYGQTTRYYLVYLKGGQVVTLWLETADDRVIVWDIYNR